MALLAISSVFGMLGFYVPFVYIIDAAVSKVRFFVLIFYLSFFKLNLYYIYLYIIYNNIYILLHYITFIIFSSFTFFILLFSLVISIDLNHMSPFDYSLHVSVATCNYFSTISISFSTEVTEIAL